MRRGLLLCLIWCWGAGVLQAETLIRVQGMDPGHVEDALRVMKGRLFFVQNRPAAPSRADDAAFLFQRHLILEGYRQVDVNWELPGDGTILLLVQKGPRYTIGEIYLRGTVVANEGEDADHRQYFLQPFKTRSKLKQDEYPYLPQDYEEGRKNVENYLRSQGYWNARVAASEPIFRQATRTVDVVLTEKPGRLHYLERPEIKLVGTTMPEELARELEQTKGKVATTANINRTRSLVEDTFRGMGYPFLKLSMAQVDEAGRTLLKFDINTGERYKLGDVKVVGNKKVDNRRIRRRFKELQGEEFERDELDRVVRKLLGTGAFETIRLTESPQEDGTVDLLVKVEEAKSYGVKVYGGVGTLEGAVLGVGYFDRNLWGQLYNFEVGLEYSGLGLLGEISLTDPFFLERDLAWKNRAFIITRDFDGYQRFSSGLETSLSYEVNDYYDLQLSFLISYNDLNEQDGLPREELGNSSYVINQLSFLQSYDRRNDKALPTKGYYLENNTRFGLASGNRAVSFLANEFTSSYYLELSAKDRLAFGGRLGFIQPLGSADRLPIDLRYFNGGPNSVRSFRQRDLGPEVNGVPRGGQSFFTLNAEYIRALVGPLHGTIFFDAGGLSANQSFGFDDPRYALGAGLQLDLPIGPVRFEYGHALNPQGNEHSGTFHFAIGTAF